MEFCCNINYISYVKLKMIVSNAMTKGYRDYMEDFISINSETNEKLKSFHVFDGHGGKNVSELCHKYVHGIFKRYAKMYPDVNFALRLTYKELDHMSCSSAENSMCGTTAVSMIITGDKLWFANCGDSEALVVLTNRESRILSQNHKVENEKHRLEKCDANITYNDGCARINNMLNVARSIGDCHLKRFVISNPYIQSMKMKNVDYVILGSDGLFDVFSMNQIENIVFNMREKLKKQKMSKKQVVDTVSIQLVKEAILQGSADNISVIVVMF